MPVDEVVTRLGTDPTQGLDQSVAAGRLQSFGPNRIEEEGAARWHRILARQFVDALVVILLIAAAISLAVGEVPDAITILVIVLLNGILGFVQEWKAEQALTALRQMLSPTCKVLRRGIPVEIDSEQVVPGDVVLLAVGDRVPADIRIIAGLNLKLDESALTGESGSVAKGGDPVAADTPLALRSSMAWMGTNVTNGHGRGVVVATGMETEFGRIAGLTQTLGGEPTPLQKKLGRLGRHLGVASVGISVLVALVGILAGKPALEMFMTGVSLAVAIVPEGLPAVVTITLALGVRSMVKRRALLRRLQAAEALGSATVIATDKTGTLTKNEMTVTRIWLPAGPVDVTGTGYDPAGHFEVDGTRIDHADRPDLIDLLETGLRCNHATVTSADNGWRAIGEPTEAALIVAAHKARLTPEDDSPTVAELSFTSARKRMTVVVRHRGGMIAHVKGAPEVILDRCRTIKVGTVVRELTESDRAACTDANNAMATTGLRTLALARRHLPDDIEPEEDAVETELTLLGIVGIIDPPRPEVPAALQLTSAAAVRPLMITGDAAETALAVAERIGMPVDRAITGPELDTMDDAALTAALEHRVLFARTAPEHKLRIVRSLQARGEIVAMTGDGVNDAPALKQAEIGVAMGLRGTDVAKAAADMVLTDDNFASIVGAVEEGRRQYDNIQKFVRYLLSSNAGEVTAVLLNIVVGGPLILLPVQILWMNLVTDGMTAVALGVEPASADLMRRPPRGATEPILTKPAIGLVLALGSYMGLSTLWLFHRYLAATPDLSLPKAQTMAFVGIVILEKMNVFNFRSRREPIRRIGFWTNPLLIVAWVATVSLQVAAVYVPFLQRALHTVPLGWWDWFVIIVIAAPIFLVVEAVKIYRARSIPGPQGSVS